MPVTVTHPKPTKPLIVQASPEETDIFYHAKCEEMASRVLDRLRTRASKLLKTGRPVVIVDASGEMLEECYS